MDTVPREGWPMRHVKVSPENDKANVSELLAAMNKKTWTTWTACSSSSSSRTFDDVKILVCVRDERTNDFYTQTRPNCITSWQAPVSTRKPGRQFPIGEPPPVAEGVVVMGVLVPAFGPTTRGRMWFLFTRREAPPGGPLGRAFFLESLPCLLRCGAQRTQIKKWAVSQKKEERHEPSALQKVALLRGAQCAARRSSN